MNKESLQIQALQKADRRKDEFLAMLAHEMRNPLAAISIVGDVMARVGLRREQAVKLGAIIAHQTQVLSRMVEDLLEVSRITRGKLKLVYAPLDLTAVVAQAVETMLPLMRVRQHELVVSVDPRPMRVEGDAVRLEQVLVNLLSNAAKFSEPGSRIRISAEPDRDEIVLRVADDGIGISANMLRRVFDMFVQAGTPMDGSPNGLGIGLALVRSFVEMHGGIVTAESAGIGQGSEFTVRLPALRERCDCEPSPVHANGASRVQGSVNKTNALADTRGGDREALIRWTKIAPDQEHNAECASPHLPSPL
jgi:signal transduction histidine kinase